MKLKIFRLKLKQNCPSQICPSGVSSGVFSGMKNTILALITKLERQKFIAICSMVMLVGAFYAHANYSSTTDNLYFDANNDGRVEMTLNNNGLGIGNTPSQRLQVSGNAMISNSLTVGSSNSGSSNLNIYGTIAYSSLTYGAGANTIGNGSVIFVDTSGGNAILTLPQSDLLNGRQINIKRTSQLNNIFIAGGGSNINSYSTLVFGSGNYSSIDLLCSGGQWYLSSYNENAPLAEVGNSGLELWWKLNESSGNIALGSSSSGRAGNLTNNLSFSGNSVRAPIATGISMGNVDDAIVNQDGISLASGSYSYSFWFYANHLSSSTMYNDAVMDGSAGFCWMSSNLRFRQSAFHKKSDQSYVTTPIVSTLSANTWHHIAVTWTGSSLNLYCNGNIESGNTEATSWTGAANVSLSNPGCYYRGMVYYDDVRFFNFSLDSDKVKALYGSGSP